MTISLIIKPLVSQPNRYLYGVQGTSIYGAPKPLISPCAKSFCFSQPQRTPSQPVVFVELGVLLWRGRTPKTDAWSGYECLTFAWLNIEYVVVLSAYRLV